MLIVGVALNVAVWWIAADVVEHVDSPGADARVLGFQMFATLTAWYAQALRADGEAICSETNAHLLATRSLLEESARDHERLRLARELHDVAGHKLTALKLNLTALERNGDAGSKLR